MVDQRLLRNSTRVRRDETLRDALAPAFESRPEPLSAVECFPVKGVDNLYLLPGHIRLSEYEVTLGIAQELSGSIQTLQNLPGSITRLLEKTAGKHSADYLLIDMNPSLSSLNQNLLLTSQYFIVPTNPDYFSVMAVRSLAEVLPAWRKWAERAAEMKVLKDAVYPFPNVTPKFLGTIVQNYRLRGGGPASAFQTWLNRISSSVSDELFPALSAVNMTLPRDVYDEHGVEELCLAKISDFNSLIAKSQEHQTPVFALSPDQIAQGGVVLQGPMQSRDKFNEIFFELATKVVSLVDHASSS